MYFLVHLIPLFLLLSTASALPHLPLKRLSGVLIASSRRPDKCLGTTFIRGARPGIGVDLVDCTSGSALTWDIERGAGYVKVSSADLVLDAGNNPGNFGSVFTETRVQGRGSQNWYFTDDDRIAITGGTQCLDDDGTKLQTYQCTTGNTNQIFHAVYTQDPNPEPAPINPYPDIPRHSEFYPDASGERRRLHPLNRGDLCATVLGGSFASGSAVAIAYCVADSEPLAKFQIFNPQASIGRSPGPIYLSDAPTYCVSTTGGNGAGITIQLCANQPTTTWQWTQSEQYFLLGGNRVCLDVQKESQPGNESPISSLRKLQTWECGFGNVQQEWTFFW